MPSRTSSSFIIPLVLIARSVYGLNWFTMSPALPTIAHEGGFPYWMLGLVPVAFYAATGIFQVPSGVVSKRFGPTRTYVLGLVVLSLGNMLIVISPSTFWVFLTRAISGIGAALFFASAGGVILGLQPSRPGLMMGLYNVAFAIGGGFGLAWGIIQEDFGWRISMFSGGMLGVLVAGVNFAAIRKIELVGRFSISDAMAQLKNPRIVEGAIAFLGTWGTYFAAGQLLPAYLQLELKTSISASGIESTPLLLASIVGGLATVVYDRVSRKKLLLFTVGILSIFPATFFGFQSSQIVISSLLVLGFFNEMSISVLYAYVHNIDPMNATASLAVVNTIQILLGMWVLPLLSIVASLYSWPMGWVAVGTIPLIPLVLLINAKISEQKTKPLIS
ncbi:MAG: MFS transporter [Nitrososphaerota archaeon]|nr:MFS transporter [Nitrososphaerota archaeon]